MNATVTIFARRPRAGEVKTRLAAALGEAAALRAYLELLAGTVDRLSGGPWRLELAVTPDEAADESGGWPRRLLPWPPMRPQGAGDLGARMMRALARASPGAPALVVGSDVPGLDAAAAAAALEALTEADLVLGPAPDGGYWGIGASRPPPADLFAGVRWSGPHARADTLANAAGLRTRVLNLELEDVDDAASWRRWRAGVR